MATHTASFSGAISALNIHLCRGFSEGEVRWSETHRQVVLKKGFEKLINNTLQISKADIVVYHKSLDLMKHRRVCQI